jgi:biotin transport system substrate-specific component
MQSSQATLTQVLWPVQPQNRSLRFAALAVVGSVLLAVSSKVAIPFYPVPMTLQTLVVLALGMAYGSRLGLAAVALYLLEGALGLPVFTGSPDKGVGLAYMLGGTGGYLLGFLPAVAITGYLAERGWDRRGLSTAAAMLLGNAAIYIPGLLWLGALYGFDKPIVQWGFAPFWLGDVVKIALAMGLLPLAWRALGRGRGG